MWPLRSQIAQPHSAFHPPSWATHLRFPESGSPSLCAMHRPSICEEANIQSVSCMARLFLNPRSDFKGSVTRCGAEHINTHSSSYTDNSQDFFPPSGVFFRETAPLMIQAPAFMSATRFKQNHNRTKSKGYEKTMFRSSASGNHPTHHSCPLFASAGSTEAVFEKYKSPSPPASKSERGHAAHSSFEA